MQQVSRAQPYRRGAMVSSGDAAYMLLRQYQFPDEFDDRLDKLAKQDHDRVMSRGVDKAQACFKKHTGTYDGGFEDWLSRAKPQEVINFISDYLKADKKTVWSGFRVLGTVSYSNGQSVFTLELFAKHPDSTTRVHDIPYGFEIPEIVLKMATRRR